MSHPGLHHAIIYFWWNGFSCSAPNKNSQPQNSLYSPEFQNSGQNLDICAQNKSGAQQWFLCFLGNLLGCRNRWNQWGSCLCSGMLILVPEQRQDFTRILWLAPCSLQNDDRSKLSMTEVCTRSNY